MAARLTERGERGDEVRETAPSFGGLPGPVRAWLLRETRSSLAARLERQVEPIHTDRPEHAMPNSYTLDSETEAFVDAAVASGRYDSVDDLVGEAVRLLASRELGDAELDAILSRGVADIQAGRVHEADEVFDELESLYGSPASLAGRP